jgi:hypothetical protein
MVGGAIGIMTATANTAGAVMATVATGDASGMTTIRCSLP